MQGRGSRKILGQRVTGARLGAWHRPADKSPFRTAGCRQVSQPPLDLSPRTGTCAPGAPARALVPALRQDSSSRAGTREATGRPGSLPSPRPHRTAGGGRARGTPLHNRGTEGSGSPTPQPGDGGLGFGDSAGAGTGSAGTPRSPWRGPDTPHPR